MTITSQKNMLASKTTGLIVINGVPKGWLNKRTPYNKTIEKGPGGGVKDHRNWDNVVYGWTKKECQTTHHPECKKIPHTVYVEKCDVNTEQECETVYESVQDENCNTVYDTKCHTSYDAPLYRNSKVNLHPFKSHLSQKFKQTI